MAEEKPPEKKGAKIIKLPAKKAAPKLPQRVPGAEIKGFKQVGRKRPPLKAVPDPKDAKKKEEDKPK